ncbi:hypothetical protein [Chryseobacterium nepalense]|uniref:Pentapeptide MXKDX repeat protein n=1 Tax=Chryseobacterium nepalense TaxID=1854498 RepID=A0ABY4K1K2_9FLAO|nr:hypothetical protein [Chryseobacterium nepalense]UPQ74487.1 hypothetical protein M0D58_10530 [Chryseobacterium nepalense]
MKNLILATALAMFGTIAVSAQTTPQKTATDSMKTDTARHKDMNNGTTGTMNTGTNNSNNNWDKSKTDTANWKNRDATTGDRKMKKKNK